MQLIIELMPRRCLSIIFVEEETDNITEELCVEEWDVWMGDDHEDPDLEYHANGKGITVPRGTFTVIAGDKKLFFKWDGMRLTDVPSGFIYYEKDISIN